ncbi:MAG: HAD family hydrolase [Verrucomicrobiota bacterium]
MLCLIFDLDGTLVNSLPGIVGSLNRSLVAHGLAAHSNAAIRSFVGDGLLMLAQRAAPAGAAPALLDSLVSQFKDDYERTWPEGTLVYPGIHNLLEELQKGGYPLAVLSNKTHRFTEVMTRTMFPRIHFAKVLGQQEGIPHKPHPAGAFQIALTLGAAVTNCVMIGDSTIDLETADNAGMQAIAVAWGYHDRKRLITAGATRIIDHPSELPGLLG